MEQIPNVTEGKELEEKKKKVTDRLIGSDLERYVYEIIRDGETPENYVFQARRILRCALQTIAHELLSTKKVEEADTNFGPKYGYSTPSIPGVPILKSKDPKNEDYIEAINTINRVYRNLSHGFDFKE